MSGEGLGLGIWLQPDTGQVWLSDSLAICAYVVVWLVSFWLGLASARLVTL